MIESWMSVLVGVFVLALAMSLIVGHYRREHSRTRLLGRMDYHHCWEVMQRRHWSSLEHLSIGQRTHEDDRASWKSCHDISKRAMHGLRSVEPDRAGRRGPIESHSRLADARALRNKGKPDKSAPH